jgi:hypothetical protein
LTVGTAHHRDTKDPKDTLAGFFTDHSNQQHKTACQLEDSNFLQEEQEDIASLIREPILVRARKIFVLACTVQKHRNHLLSAPASCKFFALECAS